MAPRILIFQLPWVPIICFQGLNLVVLVHFMSNPFLPLPSHFLVYYFSLSQCEIGVQSSAALKFGLSSKLMLFILESVHFQSCFPCWISKFGLGEGGSDSHLHTTTMRCYDVRELNLTWVKWLLN